MEHMELERQTPVLRSPTSSKTALFPNVSVSSQGWVSSHRHHHGNTDAEDPSYQENRLFGVRRENPNTTLPESSWLAGWHVFSTADRVRNQQGGDTMSPTLLSPMARRMQVARRMASCC